jgi:hypothetical protein
MILSVDNGGDIHLWDQASKKDTFNTNSPIIYFDIIEMAPGKYFFATADYMGRVTLFALVNSITKVSEIHTYFNPAFKQVREGTTGVFADFFVRNIENVPYCFLITAKGEMSVYAYNITG